MYRQGDVLLKEVKVIPASKRLIPQKGRFVLAEGEATGHAHTISELDGTLSIDSEGRMFLRTEAGCELIHQEHEAIAVAAGSYEVVRQREYTPQEIRNVAD